MNVRTSFPPRDENTIEASVTIQRAVEDVFSFYRNFRNLPTFLGDVIAIEPIGPVTSRWTIQGPLGIRVNWTIKVTDERANELIRYETVTARGTCVGWKIPGRRSLFKPASVEGGNGNGNGR